MAPSSTAMADPKKWKARIHALSTFMAAGFQAEFSGAFRENIRVFLRECGEVEEKATEGMPTWCTLLVDEGTGIVVPLYTIEECVGRSLKPFCDFCRCAGWSHHLVSKRRYHIIIPSDEDWDRKALQPHALQAHDHLLHGLIHCNGFGHLLWINGREGGSHFFSGSTIMDLWDRLCSGLRTREVTVEDLSQKKSMELRLLLGVAQGMPWFARWGYRFNMGSFGVTSELYHSSLDLLASLDLDRLMAEPIGRERDIRRIINTYRKLKRADPDPEPPLSTARDLLRYLLSLKRRPSPLTPAPLTSPITPAATKLRRAGAQKKRKRGKEFELVAAELASRWPVRRMMVAAQVIVDVLKGKRKMTRQEVRDVARLTIGDTGLLDFVLKSLGDSIVAGYLVRRRPNPSTRVLEFSLVDLNAGDDPDTETPEEEGTSSVCASTSKEPGRPVLSQVERDLFCVYKTVLAAWPEAARAVLDSKHWVKSWDLRDEEDDMLRFFCMWIPSGREMEELTRPLPPPEVVVVPPHAGMGELRWEAELALRDTYCILDGFQATGLEGVLGEEWEPVLLSGAESGSILGVRGEGADMESALRYEGGADTWAVDCACGARDDDGERMVACDACDVWHHTRCVGIGEDDPVPPMFICASCGSSLFIAGPNRAALCLMGH